MTTDDFTGEEMVGESLPLVPIIIGVVLGTIGLVLLVLLAVYTARRCGWSASETGSSGRSDDYSSDTSTSYSQSTYTKRRMLWQDSAAAWHMTSPAWRQGAYDAQRMAAVSKAVGRANDIVSRAGGGWGRGEGGGLGEGRGRGDGGGARAGGWGRGEGGGLGEGRGRGGDVQDRAHQHKHTSTRDCANAHRRKQPHTRARKHTKFKQPHTHARN